MTCRLLMSEEQFLGLCEYAPRWHACALGPVPFGRTDRTHVAVDHIMVATRDEAEERMWEHVRGACEEMWCVEFDPDRWDLVHVVMLGGN